jgi:hypothetical protein
MRERLSLMLMFLLPRTRLRDLLHLPIIAENSSIFNTQFFRMAHPTGGTQKQKTASFINQLSAPFIG